MSAGLTDKIIRKDRILEYLNDAREIFNSWTHEESDVSSDSRDREPIIAIATMLQAEDNK